MWSDLCFWAFSLVTGFAGWRIREEGGGEWLGAVGGGGSKEMVAAWGGSKDGDKWMGLRYRGSRGLCNHLVLTASCNLVRQGLSFRSRNTKSWRSRAYRISALPPGSWESQRSVLSPALQLTLRYLIQLQGAHHLKTTWSSGQTQGQEPRDPDMKFPLGCSSVFPNGILPASLYTQTFVECLLSAWLCAQHGGGDKAPRHGLSPRGLTSWAVMSRRSTNKDYWEVLKECSR